MKYPGFEDGPDAISWHTCTEPKELLRSLLGHALEILAKAGAGRPPPWRFCVPPNVLVVSEQPV